MEKPRKKERREEQKATSVFLHRKEQRVGWHLVPSMKLEFNS